MNNIPQAFEELKNNHSYPNARLFSDFVLVQDNDHILESFQYLLSEPLVGAKTANIFLTLNNVDRGNLEKIDRLLESGLSKMNLTKSNQTLESYLENLEMCKCLTEAKMKQEDINISISSAVLESSMSSGFSKKKEKDVEEYINSILSKDLPISTRVEKIENFNSKIKAKKIPLDCVRMLTLISVATNTVLYSFFVAVPFALITPILLLPSTIAAVVVDKGVKKSTKKIYKHTLMSEYKKVQAAIIAGNSNPEIKTYKDNLEKAIEMIENGEVSALESVMENVTFDIDNYHSEYEILEEAFNESYIDFILCESTVEDDIESINTMVKINNAMNLLESSYGEVLLEGKSGSKARKAINKLSHNVDKGVTKLKAKSNDAKQAHDAAKGAVKRLSKGIDDRGTSAVNKAKSVYRNDIRDEIIEDKTTFKLSRLFRKAVAIGTVAMINPFLAILAVVTSRALKGNIKEKERRKILKELEEELEIVTEKIEDSRGDENKEKKYQLMRIKNKLTKDIERIKYRLKADDKGL